MTEIENINIEEVPKIVNDNAFLNLNASPRTKSGLGFPQIKNRKICSFSHTLKNNIATVLDKCHRENGMGDFKKYFLL